MEETILRRRFLLFKYFTPPLVSHTTNQFEQFFSLTKARTIMGNIVFALSDLISLLVGVVMDTKANSNASNSVFATTTTEGSNDMFNQIAGLYLVIIVFFAAASLSIYVKSFIQERAYARRHSNTPVKMFDLEELLKPKKKKMGNSKYSKKVNLRMVVFIILYSILTHLDIIFVGLK